MASKYSFSEYCDDWPRDFECTAAEWRTVLGSEVLKIHHIGSTSVPGLAAKPIIDVLPVVKDIGRIDQICPTLEQNGYHSWGEYGIPGRRYFTKDAGSIRKVNVHVFENGNPEIERYLAFCGYLRQHSNVAKEYEALKRGVYRDHPDDIFAYNDGKNEWIRNIQPIANQWFCESESPADDD